MSYLSQEFKNLPKELKYEVLTELCERRKQSSWNKLHEMPKSSASFSGFQMEHMTAAVLTKFHFIQLQK